MSSFAVRTLVVNGNTVSTSTTTGAIRCAGEFSISGNTNVGSNVVAGRAISGSTLSASNTLRLFDGVNVGTISQTGTNLTLSSSGNIVAVAENHSLVFENDGTSQITAYTGKEIVDECDVHTYIYNTANPSTPKYMLSATFPLNQTAPGGANVTSSANEIFCSPIRLVKGQVVTGAGYYLSASGTPRVGFSLYRTFDSSYVRVAKTATESNIPSNGMNYLDYSTSYTVPVTGIYYTCLYVTSTGTSFGFVASAFNSGTNYTNYNINPITGTLNLLAIRVVVSGGPPITMTGLIFTSSTRPAYSVVYTS